MSLKRRLLNLEGRPFRRPVQRTDDVERQALRAICLPLPVGHTPEERATALALMLVAQKMPREDRSGWLAVREYAIGLHAKYGTIPFWDDEDFG